MTTVLTTLHNTLGKKEQKRTHIIINASTAKPTYSEVPETSNIWICYKGNLLHPISLLYVLRFRGITCV